MNDQTTLSTSPLEEQALAWPEKAIPEKWVKALFNKMAFSYGVKFADQWKGIDPDGIKRHWAQKLFVLTTAELTRGVERLDTRAWPPTLPEFLALCRPPSTRRWRSTKRWSKARCATAASRTCGRRLPCSGPGASWVPSIARTAPMPCCDRAGKQRWPPSWSVT